MSLGLLGMCLVVMALFYMVTILVNSNSDSSDTEDLIGAEDFHEVKTEEEQIYIVDKTNPDKYLEKYFTFHQPVDFLPLS